MTGRRVQLHRALSKLGWGSRTQAWDWIRAGRVRVDNVVVTDPLSWIDLQKQRITRDDQEAARSSLTLALHKPAGIVTTRRDEHGRRTVYDLLPPDLPWLFPAGRLDRDSEGLLIMTTDSDLAQELTAPDRHVPKTYLVTVRGVPTAEAIAQLRHGVMLSDGPTRPARVGLRESSPTSALLEITLTEGRNRQVRRMCAAVKHKVKRLVRIAIGDLTLGDLEPGMTRRLTDDEIRTLRTPGHRHKSL
jgi:pseudouridine synthase